MDLDSSSDFGKVAIRNALSEETGWRTHAYPGFVEDGKSNSTTLSQDQPSISINSLIQRQSLASRSSFSSKNLRNGGSSLWRQVFAAFAGKDWDEALTCIYRLYCECR
jgi:hypothetical protein